MEPFWPVSPSRAGRSTYPARLVRHYVSEFDLGGLIVSGQPPRVVIITDPFRVKDRQPALWTSAARAEQILRAVSKELASTTRTVTTPEVEAIVEATARACSIAVTPHADMLARVYRALDSIEAQFRSMRDKGGFSNAHRKWRADRIAGSSTHLTYSAFAMAMQQTLISEIARKYLK